MFIFSNVWNLVFPYISQVFSVLYGIYMSFPVTVRGFFSWYLGIMFMFVAIRLFAR